MANPTKPRTPHRVVYLRSKDQQWKPFLANATRAGTTGSAEIDKFIRWYNREPGAKMPTRPPAGEVEVVVCGTCSGEPPAGFTCQACGVAGVAP